MFLPGAAVQVPLQSPVGLHIKTFCCSWWSHMPTIMPEHMISPH